MVLYMKSFKFFPDLQLCYQSFGKTGNTAFLSVLIEVLNKKGFHVDFDQTTHISLNNSERQVVCSPDGTKHKKIFLNDQVRFVTSIRNPYTRVLSLYLHITGGGKRKISDNWRRKLNINNDFYDFYGFLKILERIGVSNIDGHTFPISEFSFLSDADYTYVIRFEQFYKDVKYLIESFFGIDVEVHHKGVKTKSNARVDEFYTPNCIDLVRFIYEDDFKQLGYSVDIEDCQKLPNLKRKGVSLPAYYASVL